MVLSDSMTSPIDRVMQGEYVDNPVVTIDGTINVKWVYHEKERPAVGLRQDLPALELVKRRVKWAWGATPYKFSPETTKEIQQIIGTLPDTWIFHPQAQDGSSCQVYVGEGDEQGSKYMYFTNERSAISKPAYQDDRWKESFDKINDVIHKDD